MGGRMVENLVKKGRNVVAFDLSPLALQTARDCGATTAESVAEVGAECNLVITMLPSTPHVESTILGQPTGLLANNSGKALYIDCSTIDPVASKEINAAVSAAGSRMVDAPVSGGVGGAGAGTLTFMVGGEEDALEDAKPVLFDMGTNVIHCGGAGTGEVAKLCNNLSLAVSMIGTCEAMNLGEKLGIDPKVLAGVINTSTGRCWSSDTYNPCPGVMEGVPSDRGFTGGFANELMEKDLFLASQAARASGSPTPLAANAHAIYSMLKTNGYGHLDFSSVYLMLNGSMKNH